MRYMLTGDHWGAQEAYRMGEVQEIAPTRDAAIEACASWLAAGRDVGVAVNVSARSLIDQGFPDDIAALLP